MHIILLDPPENTIFNSIKFVAQPKSTAAVFFSGRHQDWNALPGSVISNKSLDISKYTLAKHFAN